MRPQVLVGVLLIAFGAVVLAMRGISYTKERDVVRIGPVELAAEEKGFIPPVVGVIALVAGLVLVLIRPRPR